MSQSVRRPDEGARTAARERQGALIKPAGALGRLEELSVWLAGAQGASPPRPLERVRVVVFAGDHGIARAGVSAYPPEVTAQMVAGILAGSAAVSVLARTLGASVRVVDMAVDADTPPEVSAHKVRRGSGRIDVEDALTRGEAEAAFRAGMQVADEEVDAGADLLVPGDMGIGNTTPAAVLTGVLTANDAATVMGRGTGIDDRTWMVKCAAVRDAMRRTRAVLGDPVQVLATGGGADIAAMAGFLVQAAARRTPVLLDGVVSGAAALVGQRVSYRAVDWWQAGHLSTEPAHRKALDRLSLVPLVDQGLRLGEGTGALLALPLLRAAQATLAEMATFEEAGVSGPAAG
ncbi:nicotinate-nucleotide--dimethylbenzimidazole phosphoribosyltransferase [Vallicoccus soli]|uniref:nicotinate-nucleotide--dimethylbenzimidazole phosphoribosyltransferase n=1 Tax=Vallicoccus soli TaxID=2339232 RepID=UPI00319E5038